jgi:ribosomal protein S27E
MKKSGMRTNVDVNAFVEFFSFRIMLMPRIIIALNVVVTVLGLAALVCLPVAMIYFSVTGGEESGEMIRLCGLGFVVVILGMIVYRIIFEYLILFFRINETLTEILRKGEDLPPPQARPTSVVEPHQAPSRLDTETITLASPDAIYVAPVMPQLLPENEIRPGDIVFDCPFCGHNHAISPKGAGINVNCMKCGKSIAVPSADSKG